MKYTEYGEGELLLDLNFILEWLCVLWSIRINWPTRNVSFLAVGFTQVLRAEPVIADQQCLSPAQRNHLLV